MLPALVISHLSSAVENLTIVNDFSLTINPGEIHALMGPNGSGKSTLAATLMGHPSYSWSAETLTVNGVDIREMGPDERGKHGLFLAFQYPYEIEGVKIADFLRQAHNSIYGGTEKQLGIKAFQALLEAQCSLLSIDRAMLDRSLNVGFSGGEKKRFEMLQIAVLEPRVVILDEIDSGLDVDALKLVAEALCAIKAARPEMSVLVITHYARIFKYVRPNFVHIMQRGSLVKSGSALLADAIEAHGYDQAAA